MGISLLTAMNIKSGNVRIDVAGPDDNGKYAGWIMKNEDRWAPLLNTEHIYDTDSAARQAMQDLIDEINKLELKSPLDSLTGQDKKTVSNVIDAAKNKTIMNL